MGRISKEAPSGSWAQEMLELDVLLGDWNDEFVIGRYFQMAGKNVIQRIADGVKDSVIAVAQTANDNIVLPVGEALGVTDRKKPKTKSQIKAERKIMAKSLSPKEQSVRKSKAAESIS